MSSLDIDTITALLKEDKKPKPQAGNKSSTSAYPPNVHVGPLRRTDKNYTCVSKNCRAPSNLKVNGAPYCTAHALDELNRIILKLTGLEWVIDECDCKSGYYSRQSSHADDCAVYERIKELDSVNGSGGTESLPGEL